MPHRHEEGWWTAARRLETPANVLPLHAYVLAVPAFVSLCDRTMSVFCCLGATRILRLTTFYSGGFFHKAQSQARRFPSSLATPPTNGLPHPGRGPRRPPNPRHPRLPFPLAQGQENRRPVCHGLLCHGYSGRHHDNHGKHRQVARGVCGRGLQAQAEHGGRE